MNTAFSNNSGIAPNTDKRKMLLICTFIYADTSPVDIPLEIHFTP